MENGLINTALSTQNATSTIHSLQHALCSRYSVLREARVASKRPGNLLGCSVLTMYPGNQEYEKQARDTWFWSHMRIFGRCYHRHLADGIKEKLLRVGIYHKLEGVIITASRIYSKDVRAWAEPVIAMHTLKASVLDTWTILIHGHITLMTFSLLKSLNTKEWWLRSPTKIEGVPLELVYGSIMYSCLQSAAKITIQLALILRSLINSTLTLIHNTYFKRLFILASFVIPDSWH